MPAWLGAFSAALSRSTQTPTALAALLTLSALATACQGKLEVSPTGSGYREPVNLFVAVALPPGSRKSAVITAAAAPLTAWERRTARQMAQRIEDTENARAVILGRIEKLKRDAAKKSDPGARENILAEIRGLAGEMPEELRPRRLWATDATPEAVQMGLAGNLERFSVLSDEGGLFEILAGLYSDGKSNLDIILQAHAGTSCRVERMTRTIHLETPALTLGLAVQNEILAELGRGNKRRFRGTGLLARFLFALPTSNIGLRDMERFDEIPAAVVEAYHRGISALLDHPEEYNADGKPIPRPVTLSGPAFDAWVRFAQGVENSLAPGRDLCDLADWGSKLPGACLRIAGLFHAAEKGLAAPRIELATMRQAIGLCRELIPHAVAAFSLISGEAGLENPRYLFDWFCRERVRNFSRGEVFKLHKNRFKTAEDLTEAVEALVERGIVRGPLKEKTSGRPKEIFVVNPTIFEGQPGADFRGEF